jgi:hypothetical protein
VQAGSAGGCTLRDYLVAPAPLSAVSLLLFAVASHSSSSLGEPLFPAAAMGVLGAALLWVFAAPRWAVYVALATLLLVANYSRVFVNAQGAHDSASVRDEAAEYTAREFLAGRDPWSHPDRTVMPLTTGYSAVLFLSPFVAVFGRIDEAAFLFWCAFLLALLLADLRHRNGAFLPLSLAYLAGALELFHTQNWALDELYFPFAFILLALALARRHQAVLCGVALAVCVFWRPNYAFVCLGFVIWLSGTLAASRRVNVLARLAVGFVLGAVGVLSPFVARSGLGGLGRGPLSVAFTYLVDGGDGPLANAQTSFAGWWLHGWCPPPAVTAGLRIALASMLIWALAARLRAWTQEHPFWHACLGGWMAQTIVWHPDGFQDYQLMLVLPAFLAIAFTPRRGMAVGGAPQSTSHSKEQ